MQTSPQLKLGVIWGLDFRRKNLTKYLIQSIFKMIDMHKKEGFFRVIVEVEHKAP